VTTRIAFAMSRDGALPGSSVLYNVNEWTKSPVRVVLVIYLFDAILLLLQLANSAAFSAIVSLCTIGFQISYAIPIWLRVTQSRNTFKQGAFNLGRYSIACGWISASWLTFTSLLFFWPFSYPVNEVNMNYTVVVVGAVAICAIIFWLASARFWFEGPKKGANDLNLAKKGEELIPIDKTDEETVGKDEEKNGLVKDDEKSTKEGSEEEVGKNDTTAPQEEDEDDEDDDDSGDE